MSSSRRGRTYLGLWGAEELDGRYEVAWNRRLRTTAGQARLRSLRIELNPRLLERHPERVLEVFVHELAHLVVYRRHGRAARLHGRQWRALMRRAGFAPEPRHGMDVGELARGSWLYLHLCLGCPAWWITRRLRRDLVCPRCGPDRVEVHRAPGRSEGLHALEQLGRRHARRQAG
ncbi:MAG: SprT family zinc-dependent metalloprotease [Planctomycetota bacterium]